MDDKKSDLGKSMVSPRGIQASGAGFNNNNNINNSRSSSSSLEEEFAAVTQRVAELTSQLARLVHPTAVNPFNQKLRDLEVTSVILRVRENVVIAVSPNTLSSVHRWLDSMSKDAVVVNSYWDALKISLTKSSFFSPKHLLETLQVSLHVPPLRLELYSALGEHLCAGLLVNDLSLSLSLQEQMAISGEGKPEPERRRGLTNLVKV